MSYLRSQFVAALVVCAASLSYSQSQATCTFNLFQAPGLVNGVNDFRTTVGENSQIPQQAFVRYSGGGFFYFSGQVALATSPMARNDGGVTVGTYTTQGTGSNTTKGFIFQGPSTFTSFTHPRSVWGTHFAGINKYNSIVGWYLDSAETAHGFKRYSNGGLAGLDYPGASQGTTPAGINDFGTVAGSFSDSTGGQHGFIYHAGTWAKVDFPNSNGQTQLVGISNNNVVVGFSTLQEPYVSFIYANGVFKTISAPNTFNTIVTGVSANGIISGNVVFNAGGPSAFTATCK